MRLDDQRESDNVEDRRGNSGGGGGFGGGLSLGAVVVVLVISYFTGISPSTLMGLLDGAQVTQQRSAPVDNAPISDEESRFVSKILASTEDTWQPIFRQNGGQYQDPRLVLFTGSTPTACGRGEAAMGPFYCPGDNKVYIDLSFFRELRERFRAPGEFAQAYVIAHEVGHHVQNLLGVSGKVDAASRTLDKVQANALSVRLELQADCFAGVWAHQADSRKKILEPGELEQAIVAASAIGDNRLQKQAQGYAVPDSFTHGTSAQRVRWFKRGFETGDMNQCNTFKVQDL